MTQEQFIQLTAQLNRRLDKIEATINALALSGGHNKWLTEVETIQLTGLAKRSLLDKRKSGVFTYSTATGRKIKYLRKDVENYLNQNASQLLKTA
jgi:hypothetical protein